MFPLANITRGWSFAKITAWAAYEFFGDWTQLQSVIVFLEAYLRPRLDAELVPQIDRDHHLSLATHGLC